MWRSLLTEVAGLERASFVRTYGRGRDDFLDRLARFFILNVPPGQPHDCTTGYLGLFLLTAALYDQIDARRTQHNGVRLDPAQGQQKTAPGAPPESAHLDADLPRKLLQNEHVREAIGELYRPPARERAAADLWSKLDFSKLRFHALGTTSFIVQIYKDKEKTGDPAPYALKLLLYPYTKIPVIAEATREYADRWAPRETPPEGPAQWQYLVTVYRSTDRWILMEFVPGRTLQEFLDQTSAPPASDASGAQSKLAALLQSAQSKLAAVLQRLGRDGKKAEQPPRRDVQLGLLSALGEQLFNALDELQQTTGPRAHLDLSLSNVIVGESTSQASQEASLELKLVDYGRNYLYTRQIGALEGVEAFTVAPEVKNQDPDASEEDAAGPPVAQAGPDKAWYADAYSLGHLLIALGGVGRNQDGTVPDEFYERTPALARFIEDLIEQDPAKRLVLFDPSQTNGQQSDRPFAKLGRTFVQELDAVVAARAGKVDPNQPQWLRSAWQFISPFSGVLLPMWRLKKERSKQELIRDPRRSMYARGLLNWALLCTAMFSVIWTLCLVWLARDLADPVVQRIPPLAKLVDFASTWGPFDIALGRDEFPVPWLRWLDRVQEPSYQIPQLVTNLPARIIGLSFALLGVKVYMTLFSSLTLRAAGAGRFDNWITTASMRWYTFNWAILIAFANLVNPRYWTICTAIGLTTSFLTNWTCRRFARKAIEEARSDRFKLTTVPDGKIPGLEGFYVWTPSMGFYVAFVWICALLIDSGRLHDVYFYVAAVASVNIGLFYLVKCGRHGAEVRGGLTRAFLAAERVRRVAEAPAGGIEQTHPPPEPVGAGERRVVAQPFLSRKSG